MLHSDSDRVDTSFDRPTSKSLTTLTAPTSHYPSPSSYHSFQTTALVPPHRVNHHVSTRIPKFLRRQPRTTDLPHHIPSASCDRTRPIFREQGQGILDLTLISSMSEPPIRIWESRWSMFPPSASEPDRSLGSRINGVERAFMRAGERFDLVDIDKHRHRHRPLPTPSS